MEMEEPTRRVLLDLAAVRRAARVAAEGVPLRACEGACAARQAGLESVQGVAWDRRQARIDGEGPRG